MHDKVINVPVEEGSVINTLNQLPRTPEQAGLIEVTFKRKLEMKNSHIRGQLVNPDKLYKVLDNLKSAGNPHYQFYDDFNTYTLRLKDSDKVWINEVEDEILREQNESDHQSPEEEEDEDDQDEQDYRKKDPARRHQADGYGRSFVLADMFPEARHQSNYNAVTIAPAEGEKPKNVLFDEGWEVKAFPDLCSPDGKYGLDYKRPVKLTPQNYFIQTICNMEPKFAKTPSYVYAAVAYIEQLQITRNLNMAGRRGREVVGDDGKRSYKLDDAFDVLDNVKQTPRYWRKAKNEMYAKIDNLGQFQVWFTLTAADLRYHIWLHLQGLC